MMDEATLSIVHKYISLEWARKTLEHDLKLIKHAGFKYPKLFEEAAVEVLNQLSIQMKDLKQLMRQKEIKVVYKGRNKDFYDAVEYEIYVGKRKYPWDYAIDRLKWMAFGEIEKAMGR